ncbi:tripartite tricarboxylate transporter substrate-binding protein [Roseococcus sp.]|uniref:tripartite tricarboxylate transporter substrate-binding protein n=1 Tax=Roseococcus sp. TaxID=2109646 RepID=UPI003BAC7285
MSRWTRRGAIAAGLAAPWAARAQGNPQGGNLQGPIRLLVPFAPGGTADQIARLVQPGLQQRLGTTVVVENRPGAYGSIGAAAAVRAAPDGNTWLFVFDTHAVNPSLLASQPFDHERDLAPVMLIGTAPNVIAAHPSRAYRTLGDVLAAAEARPGEINYTSAGQGSLGHLTMVLIAQRRGLRMVHVPYSGGAAPAVTAALANQVDVIIAATTVLSAQFSAETLRPLAQTAPARHASLLSVPTLSESGLTDIDATPWWGVYAPGATPRPLIDRFNTELSAALRGEEVNRRLTRLMGVTVIAGGPEQMREHFARQVRLWGDVVRQNNIRTEG